MMLSFVLLCSLLFRSSSPTTVCPSSCYCDDRGEYVSCVGDGLWRYPDELPNTTIRLELRNYLVSELFSQDLHDLAALEELKLQQSRIEILENATFASNPKLEKLDLSQNILTSLSSSVFADLRCLRHLDVSSNFIEFLEGAFVDLVNLEQLNLRDNRLPQLTIRSFVGLHKIQYLNLDANNISAIEVGTFQYLTNLAHLIISNNPLTTLSRLDFFGSRLQYIDISHVGLDRVPQSLTKFVRDLRLAKNNLTHISAGDFDSYPYLGLLVLDDNCVSEIENDALGRQEYLMRLWLNGNCLTRVPPNLPPSLLALYMEENKLTSLQSYSFKGLVHLEQLFLQRNEIQDLHPCVFCDLVSLKSLDLQANQIENLTTGVFFNLTQLETLDLSQNNLKVIDARCFDSLSRLMTLQMSRVHTTLQLNEAMFDPLHSLQTLEVYDSSLLVQTILNSTRMMHGLRKVQELNIMHNRIIKLRSDFPSFFPSLKVIKLSGNLWHCDQDIKWLSNWIKQSNVQFYSSYNIRCAGPTAVQFKPLMMLTDRDFETTSAKGHETEFEETATTPKTDKQTTARTFNGSSTTIAYNGKITDTSVSTEKTAPIMRTVPGMHILTEQIEYSTPITTHHVIDAGENVQSINISTTTPSVPFETNPTPQKSLPSESSTTKEEFPTHSLQLTSSDGASEFSGFFNVTAFARISNKSFLGSSRLKVSPSDYFNTHRGLVILVTLAGTCFLLGVGALATCRLIRRPYQPVKRSSISYYPQKDEVSIVTLTEGTIGMRTSSHHGLGNKLYYIMENNGSALPERDATPDPQLQELLPQSPIENNRLY